MSLGIFLFDDAQRLDSSRETDVGQALDDGGGQCLGRKSSAPRLYISPKK